MLVVVFTWRGEVLLLERSQPRGFWQSVTGSLEWGESAGAAASRELFEETGLVGGSHLLDLQRRVCFPIIAPWRSHYAPGASSNTEHWYALGLPDRRLVRRRPAEHRQHRWLPWPLAWRRASSWTNRAAIAHLFANQKVVALLR